LGDLDGDGDLDALTGSWDQSAKVWINTIDLPAQILNIKFRDGVVVINYIGTLLTAERANGDYVAVDSASSPYSVAPKDQARFFRAR